MKTIYKILFFIITITGYSQVTTTIPLNSYEDFQSGAYLKDTNYELNPFEGTWYFINNNIKYTLVLQKMEQILITRNPSSFYYYVDKIVIKYEVRDLGTNTVLYTTMDTTLYDDFEITSLGGVYNGELEFDFFDNERCNVDRIRLYKITVQSGTTIPYQVRYFNFGGDGYLEQDIEAIIGF